MRRHNCCLRGGPRVQTGTSESGRASPEPTGVPAGQMVIPTVPPTIVSGKVRDAPRRPLPARQIGNLVRTARHSPLLLACLNRGRRRWTPPPSSWWPRWRPSAKTASRSSEPGCPPVRGQSHHVTFDYKNRTSVVGPTGRAGPGSGWGFGGLWATRAKLALGVWGALPPRPARPGSGDVRDDLGGQAFQLSGLVEQGGEQDQFGAGVGHRLDAAHAVVGRAGHGDRHQF
jgi:hypothetical protein